MRNKARNTKARKKSDKRRSKKDLAGKYVSNEK